MLLHFGSHAHNVSQTEAAWANFAARLELEGERVRRTEGSDPRPSQSRAVWGYLPSHFPDGPDGEFNPEHRGRYTQPSARCEAHAAGAAASEPANNFRRGAALRFAARHGLAVLDGWADAVGNHDDHLGGALTRSRIAGRAGAFDCKCAARCRTRAPTGSIAYILTRANHAGRRHWCAPGRTLRRLMQRLIEHMQRTPLLAEAEHGTHKVKHRAGLKSANTTTEALRKPHEKTIGRLVALLPPVVFVAVSRRSF